MRVLIVSQVPDSRLLGVPRVLYCVGDVLQARGHTVDYVYENNVPTEWFTPLLKKISLLEWGLRAAPVVKWYCKQHDYDVILITTASGWALSTMRDALIPKKTKIVSSHHGWEELMWVQMLLEEKEPGGEKFSPQFKLYYGGMILWALRQSLATQDGFVFTSSEERDHVAAKYPNVASKCYFVANGVTADYFYPQRFSQGFPVESPVRLLFTGYWDPWRKGKKYLIGAFERIVEKHPNVTLTLAGTKLTADDILPEFSPAVRDKISVVPHADEAGMIDLYRSHDVFVLPSMFEGMPLVMLEAMASGLPCVTTNNNGMADVIESGVNGLLVPRRDTNALVEALSQLIGDAALRKRMGEAAMNTVREKYTWDIVGAEWERVLTGIAGEQ